MPNYVEYQSVISELGGVPRLIEWARALKPGDAIVVATTHDLREAKYGTVTKVTPTYVWALVQYRFPHQAEPSITPTKFLIVPANEDKAKKAVRDGHVLISASFMESRYADYFFPVEGRMKEFVEHAEARRIRTHQENELAEQAKHRATVEAAAEVEDILRRSWDFAGRRLPHLTPTEVLNLAKHMRPLLSESANSIIDAAEETREEKKRNAGRDAVMAVRNG